MNDNSLKKWLEESFKKSGCKSYKELGNKCGISANTLSRMRNNNYIPGKKMLQKICDACGVEMPDQRVFKAEARMDTVSIFTGEPCSWKHRYEELANLVNKVIILKESIKVLESKEAIDVLEKEIKDIEILFKEIVKT